MTRRPRPLPRGVDPIPGESLSGYLVRLAHRLGLSPFHLAKITGWTISLNGTHLAQNLLFELPAPILDSFAHATRLTRCETAALTLSSWKNRYPPIAHVLAGGSDGWQFTGRRRHCPQCLAGDGTELQQRHGGGWRKTWHLAVDFACEDHQVFLRLDCPRCGTPRLGPNQAIWRPGDPTLHPNQCRRLIHAVDGTKTRCGTRLDRIAIDTAAPDATTLALQHHIHTVLDSDGPAIDAAYYFTDLKLITALITASWPHSQHLIRRQSRGIVAAHATFQNFNRAHRKPYHHIVLDTPPADSITRAALLLAAHNVLGCADIHTELTPLVNPTFTTMAARASWTRFYQRHRTTTSPRLQQSLIRHSMHAGAN